MTHPNDRPLPFNTGKVRIGSNYQRPFRWQPSRDAYDLQTALLNSRHPAPVRDPWLVRLVRRFSDIVCGRGI